MRSAAGFPLSPLHFSWAPATCTIVLLHCQQVSGTVCSSWHEQQVTTPGRGCVAALPSCHKCLEHVPKKILASDKIITLQAASFRSPR